MVSISSEKILNIHNTTLPNPAKKTNFGEFYLLKNKLYQIVEEKGEIKEVVVSKAIWCDRITRDDKTGQTMLDILFFYRDAYYKVTVSRDVLNEKGLRILTKYGADIYKGNENAVAAYLRIQENFVNQFEYRHKTLGWKSGQVAEDGALTYYHFNKYTNIHNADVSEYNGGYKINPTGTAEEWIEAVRSLVIGHIPLEFALVCGFAAVINALMQKLIPLEVIIIHIYGESSSGKTSATQVSVSGFGRPGKGGLIETWNSTFNAMMKSIADNHGVPIVFDEVSIKTNANLTAIIYQLAEGREKKRLNVEIDFREQATWSGLIMFTGEHPITEKTNQNSGLRVRTPEFHVPQWTKSAEHAQQIKAAFEQNYGHGCEPFVQKIMQTFDEEKYLQLYDKCKAQVLDALTAKDQFSERVAERYGILLMTAKIMNSCFPFQIDVQGLLQFISEQEAEMIKSRGIDIRAMDVIQQQLITEKGKFIIDGEQTNATTYYGTVKEIADEYLEVAVVKSVMDKWLRDAGFSSPSVVMKKLREEGILDHESDRNTRMRQIPIASMSEEAATTDAVENETEAQRLVKKTMYILKLPTEFKTLLKILNSKIEAPITTKSTLIKEKVDLEKFRKRTASQLFEEDELED